MYMYMSILIVFSHCFQVLKLKVVALKPVYEHLTLLIHAV